MATDTRSALIVIDLGTSSIKVALTSTTGGEVFAQTVEAYAVAHPIRGGPRRTLTSGGPRSMRRPAR
jgi:sugar (pentulose or hexulose) kinase